ncbi:hypothetical protein [Streptomyces canus]|uniref:hypothetical protein n=1 Tax=Streptomyces canus TaxID=58343 RepID=UPI0037130F9C
MVDVREGSGYQPHGSRVTQFWDSRATDRFPVKNLEHVGVAETVTAKELTEWCSKLGDAARQFHGGGWHFRSRDVEVVLQNIENGRDVLGGGLRRQGGQVLVLPHAGGHTSLVLEQPLQQLVPSGSEALGEIVQEDVGVGSHTRNV